MSWQQAIQRWRDLPETEKLRIRWERIPLKVARSMAFEGEPVDQAALEAAHKRRPLPPTALPSAEIQFETPRET